MFRTPHEIHLTSCVALQKDHLSTNHTTATSSTTSTVTTITSITPVLVNNTHNSNNNNNDSDEILLSMSLETLRSKKALVSPELYTVRETVPVKYDNDDSSVVSLSSALSLKDPLSSSSSSSQKNLRRHRKNERCKQSQKRREKYQFQQQHQEISEDVSKNTPQYFCYSSSDSADNRDDSPTTKLVEKSSTSARMARIKESLGEFGVALFCPLLCFADAPNTARPLTKDASYIKNNNSNSFHVQSATTRTYGKNQSTSPLEMAINELDGKSDNLSSMNYFQQLQPDPMGITSNSTIVPRSIKTRSFLNTENDAQSDDYDDNRICIHPEIEENLISCPRILSELMMEELRDYGMPSTLQQYRWTRCFCIGVHGDCFYSLLERCRPYRYTVIVIRTMEGDILGGFASETWQPRDSSSSDNRNSNSSYYGNGMSFLFVLDQNKQKNVHDSQAAQTSFRVCESTRDDHCTTTVLINDSRESIPSAAASKYPFTSASNPPTAKDRQFSIYKWTGKNDYCQICDTNRKLLCMGGAGDFGLVIRNCLSVGVTGRSETFGNPPLITKCSSNPSPTNMSHHENVHDDLKLESSSSFEIADFEIYGLASPYFPVTY